jgi:hypothetical protein
MTHVWVDQGYVFDWECAQERCFAVKDKPWDDILMVSYQLLTMEVYLRDWEVNGVRQRDEELGMDARNDDDDDESSKRRIHSRFSHEAAASLLTDGP